jgi:thiamine pyrophosphate-dependent acetolactate synthase large subunit-like protein
VTLPSPNFAALGRSLGCHGETIHDPADLTAAVATALEADRPTVIHLVHRDPAVTEGDQA